MNIKEMPAPTIPQDPMEMGRQILDRQYHLEECYWVIEKRPSLFVHVNSRDGQVIIKDILWRITEELGETIEASREENQDKVFEELADATHFVASLCVITGYRKGFEESFSKLTLVPLSKADGLWNLVESLGVLGNTLKMKPWKQTEVLTDLIYFGKCLDHMIYDFLCFCKTMGMNKEDIFSYYMRKSEVNYFRIRSNY